jgi:predicted ferric reductase
VWAVLFSGNLDASGSIAAGFGCLTFMTVCHNSIITLVFGLPFERALRYHKLFALLTVIAGAWHGYFAVYVSSQSEESGGTKLYGWAWGDNEWLSGFFFEVFMIAMVIFSQWPIRRKLFEFFFKSHWVLLILTGISGLLHNSGLMGFGAFLWTIDVLYRYLYLARTRYVHKCMIISLPGNVIRIQFPKGKFQYKAGQYIFICIPEITKYQFHPFSISSSPDQEYVSLHIRVLGDWTKQLYDLAHRHWEPKAYDCWMEGPYGEPAVDVEGSRYKCFLMLSGGIGITPMQSITNDLISQHERGRELVKVWFVWSARDSALLNSLYDGDEALPHHNSGVDLPNKLPTAFSPDVLKRTSQSVRRIPGADEDAPAGDTEEGKVEHDDQDYLHTDFHLTRARKPEDFVNANINPTLQDCLRMGRPRLPEIFASMKAIAKKNGCKEVAVLSCGPDPLIKDAKRLCWETSDSDVSFDFHTETFAF